ncbi:hypothetical protein KGF56_004383 [Candida oxycetoniae]|uniref:Uncharacterized protein n=1 Tax=Candida oxycetoniae TaxID=497107 RepID=A0AAI9STS9_9ASCO|nr:uncharacterized protein KGF56_004383 [Candida oxycetoniae]KAI3402922.1 hypothetical protein KGF56_004383 [Candida oxycetoniae]
MAPKAREDLVVPYKHVPANTRKDMGNILSQSMPMAAMFMKNKVLAWAAVFLAVQSYLNEPINRPLTDGNDKPQQPAILQILLALIAAGTCYMDLFFPSTNPALRKTVKIATETVSAISATATETI